MSHNFAAYTKFLKKSLLSAPVLLASLVSGGLLAKQAVADLGPAPWSDQVQYEVIEYSPNGAVPKAGDLVAIRFTASYNGAVIDDTFKTDEPYYYRSALCTRYDAMGWA
jgi:hypothetical protein